MYNVLISGYCGKMGRDVEKAIEETDDFEVIAGYDIASTGSDKKPIYSRIEDLDINPDIIIDFSRPEATMTLLEYAVKNRIPMVIATTGFNEDDFKKLHEASKIIPIFQASNMSYGVSVLKKLILEAYKYLDDSDIEIIESHHRRKVDAPSGTANTLAESLIEASNNKLTPVYERHSKSEKRSSNEIGMSSIRGGTVVGTHSVLFFDDYESIEITHKAESRDIFAKGSLRAARYLLGKDNGYYNMDDIVR